MRVIVIYYRTLLTYPQIPHTPTAPSQTDVPLEIWLQTLFGVQPTNQDMAPLRQRYPLLASANVSTFADVISVSAKFLRTNAIKTVGAHAANFYESQPCMDLTEILADASQTVDDYLPPTRYTTLHNRSVIVPPVWPHTCVPTPLQSKPFSWPTAINHALVCIRLSPDSISTDHSLYSDPHPCTQYTPPFFIFFDFTSYLCPTACPMESKEMSHILFIESHINNWVCSTNSIDQIVPAIMIQIEDFSETRKRHRKN